MGIVIRREQNEALRSAQEDEFVSRLVRHVRRHFGNGGENAEAEIRAEVREAVERARGHEIESQRDIARYVSVASVLGHCFDTEVPWAAEVLDPPLPRPAASRVEQLERELLERLALEGAP